METTVIPMIAVDFNDPGPLYSAIAGRDGEAALGERVILFEEGEVLRRYGRVTALQQMNDGRTLMTVLAEGEYWYAPTPDTKEE